MNKMAWVPLESNPAVMSKFLVQMGVSNKWNFVDVFSVDEELLGMIPRPVAAFILLFPCSEKYNALKEAQEKEIKAKGQIVSENVYYLKQEIPNACGAIALIHSVANNVDLLQLGDGCLKQFLSDTKALSPEERGKRLIECDAIANIHSSVAVEGQTEAPNPEESVNYHFVSFIHKDGAVYELDGRKAFPINHGPTTQDSFVNDVAKVLQKLMAQDPTEVKFTVVALTAGELQL